VRFRPEIALLHLDVAQLLSDNYRHKRAEALEHIRLAPTEFQDMHMQPSLDRAIKLAERLAPTSLETQRLSLTRLTQRATQQRSSDTLTARRREVTGFIAGGLSNRDIAAAMVITEGTVEVQVKHILSKLEFRSRSQVAVWASEHGLTHAATRPKVGPGFRGLFGALPSPRLGVENDERRDSCRGAFALSVLWPRRSDLGSGGRLRTP
jgi:DNA-binding CsgD family transcriptional regulator